MNAAFVLTKSVKHLAAWTRDRDNERGWATGSWRPICGGKLRSPLDTYWLGNNEQWEDERARSRQQRLPLCLLCQKALGDLNDAAGGAS